MSVLAPRKAGIGSWLSASKFQPFAGHTNTILHAKGQLSAWDIAKTPISQQNALDSKLEIISLLRVSWISADEFNIS